MEQTSEQIQTLLAKINQLEHENHELKSNIEYNSESQILEEIYKNQKYIEKLQMVNRTKKYQIKKLQEIVNNNVSSINRLTDENKKLQNLLLQNTINLK